MYWNIVYAVLLPFLGTAAGAAFVFFLKEKMSPVVQRSLAGFAAGVMIAASIWSLLLPAIAQSAGLGKLAFLPACIGVWVGFLFLLGLDRLLYRKEAGSSTMLVLAVALHNLPEGMAVGVVAAGWLAGIESISEFAALTLSLGIALQNLPEGAIISLPLGAGGMGRCRSFGWGVLSGVIEPIGAIATIALAGWVVPLLPYLLSFSAGAMLYVVVQELIPEMSGNVRSDTGIISFAAGFTLMMALDCALG